MKLYIATIIMTAFAMSALITLIHKNNTLSKKEKLAFVLSSSLIAVSAFAECLGVILNGQSVDYRIIHSVVKFAELSLAPVIPVVFGVVVYPIKRHRLLSIPILVHTLIEFLSMFFGIVFYVDQNNIYHHCTFYAIYYIAYFLGTVFLLVQVMRLSMRYQNQNKSNLAFLMLFILAGIITQAVDGTLRIVWLAIAVGDILFYIYYCDLIQQVDSLTGLLNRRSYEIRIEREEKRVCVLIFDVNGFKGINDRYGHPFGDVCLTTIGKSIKEAYGKSGYCYRIGGDEFCVILDKNLDAVNKLNADFADILTQKRLQEKRLPTVAVGYAVFEPGREDLKDTVAVADQMMYVKKEKVRPILGKNSDVSLT